MRGVLRIVTEGSTILVLALFSAALHCTLRSLRSQRAAVPATSTPNGFAAPSINQSRRPIFLSRRDLL
jgi:hypothetical protein